LTTIFIQSPLEFNIFPAMLVATTLSRLVLNLATTRLVLTRTGDEGLDAAGDVIRAFGEFVSGDSIEVGIILFVIIFLINFIVITKGASRIGEVAARFALDGMPGRQMAGDADLSAGAIDEKEAQRRREEITQQADFLWSNGRCVKVRSRGRHCWDCHYVYQFVRRLVHGLHVCRHDAYRGGTGLFKN
jgi:flagellar biosynthesis protein FlhA